MNMTLEELYESWLLTLAKIIRIGLLTFVILLILSTINPDVIAPFTLFEFWRNSSNHWTQWYEIGQPLFAWGCGLQIFLIIVFRNVLIEAVKDRIYFGNFLVFSLLSGLVEEIVFRWLIFLGNIILIKWVNLLFFGWLKWGIWQGIHHLIFAPITNALTWGYLHNYLANPDIWFVGASMIFTNAMFRDGHKYQGCVGWLNSWFIGMFLFWVMFNYGLVTAILIHIFYNSLISVIIFMGYSILKRRY